MVPYMIPWPITKIDFDPPQQGKSALVLIFEFFHYIDNFVPDVEILSKNFVITPWKMIIPYVKPNIYFKNSSH